MCVFFSGVHVGRPGSPGGSDLVSALRRLTLRRQNLLCERRYFQAERNKKLQELSDGVESEGGGSGCSSPMGSIRSSFTNLSEFSVSSSCFKTFLPEKLQIVKPMEGESFKREIVPYSLHPTVKRYIAYPYRHINIIINVLLSSLYGAWVPIHT